MIQTVRCPHCQTITQYSASNPARPFCSARCKQLDLGAWASNSFIVEGAAPTTLAELDALDHDSDIQEQDYTDSMDTNSDSSDSMDSSDF